MEELLITQQKQSCLLCAAQHHHTQNLTFFMLKLVQCPALNMLNKLLHV